MTPRCSGLLLQVEDAKRSKEDLMETLAEEEEAVRVLSQLFSLVQGYFESEKNTDATRIWNDLMRK